MAKKKIVIPLVGVMLFLSVAAVVLWKMAQPQQGVIVTESTRQPKNNQPFSNPDAAVSQAVTECFTYELPFAVKYPKTEVSETGCVLRAGLMNKPGLFSMSQQTKPEGYTLSEDPSVRLRERTPETYSSYSVSSSAQSTSTATGSGPEITNSSSEEIRGFKTEKEVVVFIWRAPTLTTVSLYELGRVDETVERWVLQLVETVRATE